MINPEEAGEFAFPSCHILLFEMFNKKNYEKQGSITYTQGKKKSNQ